MQLESAPKSHTYDQDKVVDPRTTVRDTMARLRMMSDITSLDIQMRVNPIAGAHSFTSASNLLNASGKGLTAEQAQASAIMELAERYSWMHYDYTTNPGYRVASHAELQAEGVPTVDGSYFLHTFVGTPDREALQDEIAHIPLRWVLGTSLYDGGEFYYPLNWHNMVFASNGLAAGNSLEEAILQATCEVIERENVFKLFVERAVGNDIDPASLRHPLLRAVLAEAESAGIEFTIKDISFDLGVPTFIVRGTRAAEAGRLTHQGCGHGCHPQPEKALIRAFSEYFEGYSSLAEIPEHVGLDMGILSSVLPEMHYGFHALLHPEMLDESNSTVNIDQLPDLSMPDIRDEITLLAERLHEHDHTLVAIDKTHASLGVPAVRVLVPSLRNCMNHELVSPELAISEVYHEAGQSRAAMTHVVRFVQQSPFFALMKGFAGVLEVMIPLVTRFDSSMVFSGDYRQVLRQIGALKKGAAGTLERMGNIREMLAGPIGR